MWPFAYAERVNAGREDDALSWDSWDGDDDPTLDPRVGAARDRAEDPTAATAVEPPVRDGGPAAPAPDAAASPLPEGFTAVGPGSERVTASAPADVDEAPAGMGNVTLVALGVLGGVYLLYSIGWIIGGLRLQSVAAFLVANDGQAPVTWAAGNVVALVLAVLAPVIWFVTVIVLTRASAAWMRWVFLVLGVILLVPWPFIMVGAIGA